MLIICKNPNKIRFVLFVVVFVFIGFENQSSWAKEQDEYYNLKYDCERVVSGGAVWLDGDCKSYYPDKQAKVVTHFVNNRLNGELKEYFESGELKAELHYENGWRVGLGKFYYESGKLKAEDNYQYGVPVGTFEFYYESGPTTYTIKSKEYYIDGKLDEKEWFYPNGKLWKHALHYKGEGLIDGFSEEYDADGKLQSKQEYKNGKLDQISEEYYKSGSIKVRRFFEKGRETREAQFYPDGSLESPEGQDESENVKFTQSYTKGTPSGTGVKPSSNLASEQKIGKPKYFEKVYLKNGQIIKCSIVEKDKDGVLANVDGNNVYYKNLQIKEIADIDKFSSYEDKVCLKNGKVFECSVVEKDKNGIWVEIAGGKVYFSNSEIKEIGKATVLNNTDKKNEK